MYGLFAYLDSRNGFCTPARLAGGLSAAVWAAVLVLALLPISCGGTRQPPGSPSPSPRPNDFSYRGRIYSMDTYAEIFGATDEQSRARLRLITSLAENGAQAHSLCAGPCNGEQLWSKLNVEERATFLAITNALFSLKASLPTASGTAIDWIKELQAVRGEHRIGSRVQGAESFRLYVCLSPASVSYLKQKGGLKSNCRNQGLRYSGRSWRNHPEVCRPGDRFDDNRKIKPTDEDLPIVQFSYTEATGCGDIDLDFRTGLRHFHPDNSNVLAWVDSDTSHLEMYGELFCDPGFRLRE